MVELLLIVISALLIYVLARFRSEVQSLLRAVESLTERGFVGADGLRISDSRLRQFWERWSRGFRDRYLRLNHRLAVTETQRSSLLGSAELSKQIVEFFQGLDGELECSVVLENEREGSWRVLGCSASARYLHALQSPVRSLKVFGIILEEIHRCKKHPELLVHLGWRGASMVGFTERASAAESLLTTLAESLELENRKQQGEEQRRALIGVSHDLRQPTLIALAKLRERNERLPEIESLLAEQLNLLSDLLDYERASLGTLKSRPQSVVLVQVVAELAQIGSLPISSKIDDSQVYVDRKQLRRILGNLISNAAKSGVDVKVSITLSHLAGGALELSVCDNGRGVPKEIANRLFQPIEGELVEKGLGLSICRVLAEKNGITLSYRPAPIQGSIFSVLFPKELVITEETPPSSHSPRSSILIAEDDEATARFYTRTVEALGHIPIRVTSRQEVTAYLSSNQRIGALLTDISLADGEITEDLLEEGSRLPPTLVISGYDEPDKRLAELGISFIQKPAEVSEISASLQALLASARMNSNSVAVTG